MLKRNAELYVQVPVQQLQIGYAYSERRLV